MKTRKNLNMWLAMAVAIAGLAEILSSPDKVYSQEIIMWQREFGAIVNGQYMSDAYSGGLWWTRPTLVDIDSDGDYDMFVGELIGNINFYRNDGTPTSPSWTLVTVSYNSIDVGKGAAPTFCDIDNDGDYDMFIGNQSGTIYFYRNDGTPTSPSWTLVTGNYASVNVGWCSAPTFCDIDDDGDYDMFVGRGEPWKGTIYFYRNDGTPTLSSWTFVTGNYNSINVGCDSTPTFCDIDDDGDYDMFVGGPHRNVRYYSGNLKFYRNDGTPGSPSWTLVTPNYNSINTWYNTASFCDIDSDGDYDMFVGESEGNINFYRNDGTPTSPSWMSVPVNYDNSIGVAYGSPTFCDIDSDGDYDMFLSDTNIYFWRNDGIPTSPSWTLVTDSYDSITGARMTLTFCDIDDDGDYDMFVGEGLDAMWIRFYRNDGTPEFPEWTLVTRNYASISTESYEPTPTFCDIDNDGDYDMFVGEWNGNINYYRNDGVPESPDWTFITKDYASINVGSRSVPTFCDIDNDGDYDLFVGERDGNINFYLNIGTPTSPSWTLVTEHYNSLNVGWNGVSFCDIDDDGDYDMFVGDRNRGINFWRNITTEAPRDLYVDDDASNDPGPGNPDVSDPLEDGTQTHPFDAIQEAIDAAQDGETVIVLDGRYTDTGNRDIDFHGKAITVRSKNGPGNCIVDCQPVDFFDQHRGFCFHSGEGADSVLDGFTITNGMCCLGGGIFCSGSSPTITNNIIKDNKTCYDGEGGGMYNGGGNPLLINCIFKGNAATYGAAGGGMYNAGGSPTLINCTFTGNISGWDGGGMYNRSSSPILINCIFWDNVDHRIFTDIGKSDESAQIYGGTPVINYSCIQGWTGALGGIGNFGDDPLFVELGYWDDRGEWKTYEYDGIFFDGDYHLLRGSPCIDAGDPNYIAEPNEIDLDGKPRVVGARIDMGAYEYRPLIPAEVRIVPRSINLTSKGKWITCYIWLGEDYNVADIDPNSVFLEDEIETESFRVDEEEQVAIAKFSRSEVQEMLEPGDVELAVSGELSGGTRFEGTDTIRVIDKGRKK